MVPLGRSRSITAPPTLPITVLKLGSSVLDRKDGLSRAVYEIYRELRKGRRVLAVVSAFKGVTDWLLRTAQRHFEAPQPTALAVLVATGETASAAFLAMALDQAGVAATVADPHRVGLEIRGSELDGHPVDIDTSRVHALFEQYSVLIVPGFIGRTSNGCLALLGRGGSDLTAVFAAHRLNATTCRLLKDVDGMVDFDPRCGSPSRLRYRSATWDEALRAGGKLVQDKAVRFAKEQGMSFEVSSPLSERSTQIGRGPVRMESNARSRPPLRVLLLGLGNVGLGVYQRLRMLADRFEVAGIAVRDPGKNRGVDIPASLLAADPWSLLERPADVIVELIGGREPAASLIQASLEMGRHVVTANKEVLAYHECSFRSLADSAGVQLRYSSSVGGAVPVLEHIRRLARWTPIERVEGVLSGTCNYVLDRMAEGLGLAEAVRLAQHEGLAEADPATDLSGSDSAHKLAIIVRSAFGVSIPPAQISCRGIEALTADDLRKARVEGATVKFVASAHRAPEGIRAAVRPVRLPADHPLAAARDEDNGIRIHPRDRDPVLLQGKGAGRWPTSLSVTADLLDLHRAAVGGGLHGSPATVLVEVGS